MRYMLWEEALLRISRSYVICSTQRSLHGTFARDIQNQISPRNYSQDKLSAYSDIHHNLKEREITMRSNLSSHILPTSATMIGVCMTVISIVKLIGVKMPLGRVDQLLAFDSAIFMISAGFSYFSIRVGYDDKHFAWYEKIADLAFMQGLVLMTITGFLLAYELL